MPYLAHKEQKWLFLVLSLSDMHIDFDFARWFFFCVPDRARTKNRARRGKFVQHCVRKQQNLAINLIELILIEIQSNLIFNKIIWILFF